MASILADIELNEKQVKAFNEELNAWKEKQRAQLKEESKTEIEKFKSELETEFQVKLKEVKEEKSQFERKQEVLVEEIKDKMQKVMVKRFTEAIKSIYDELKVEARKDVMGDPRILAMEHVKEIMYPLMDETVTKGYVDELVTALKMNEAKEVEIDKLKARLKLKSITATLSPTVAEAVEAFIGDASSEEEVVEKYARLKKLVGETSDADKISEAKEDEDEDEEADIDFGAEEDEDDEDEEEGKKKKKKKRKKGKEDKEDDDDEEEDEEEDEEDEDEDMEEELEIKPTVHIKKKDGMEKEIGSFMTEQLRLAGIKLNS